MERRAYLDAYHVVDVAHKVVGVGSVGHLRLHRAAHGRRGRDELLLQVKEAERVRGEDALGDTPRLAYGERVVVGSWMMQGVSDPFLGWTQLHGRSFYVRQLKDMKGSVDPAMLTKERSPCYARRCGYTLGLAHARAGDPDAILGYIGEGAEVAEAMWEFSEDYADQTERDFGRFLEAIRDGRLKAAALELPAPESPAKVPKRRPPSEGAQGERGQAEGRQALTRRPAAARRARRREARPARGRKQPEPGGRPAVKAPGSGADRGRAASAAPPPLRFLTASRSRYSTCALTLRSSSAAHFSSSAQSSGSMRSRNCLRAAIGSAAPRGLGRLAVGRLTCTACRC